MNPLAYVTASLSSFVRKTKEITIIPTTLPLGPFSLEKDLFLRNPISADQNNKSDRSSDMAAPSVPKLLVVCGGEAPLSIRSQTEGYKSIKKVILDGDNDTTSAIRELSGLIASKSDTVNNLVLRGFVKADALNWPGSLHDCELVLRQDPGHKLALMLRAIATVKGPLVGDAIKQGKAIAAGITAGLQSPNDRYAVLIAHGVSERCDNVAVERVAKLADGDSSDRCALALLLTIHFKRWYWGDDPESLTKAVAIAQKMQEQWPNDRIAMSALFYLIGGIGRGNRAAMDFASRNITPGDDIHHKSVIRPRLVLDYPMYIQRPNLKYTF